MTLVTIARRDQLLSARSTDVRMVGACSGSWFLSRVMEAEQIPSLPFHLGTQLHQSVQACIEDDLSLPQALEHLHAGIIRRLEELGKAPRIIEGKTRTRATMHSDSARMLRSWHRFSHPSSPARLDIYKRLAYPPACEVEWHRPDIGQHGAWGTIDHLYTDTTTGDLVAVDIKTNRRRITDEFQLQLYAWSVGATRAFYHYLDRSRPGDVIHEVELVSEAHIRQRIEATTAIKAAALDGEYPRFNAAGSPLCRFCPVQAACPARGTRAEREAKASHIRALLREVR